MKRCELQPIFTELRLFKDSAAALRGSPQPSQYLSDSKKISTNTETEMLSMLRAQITIFSLHSASNIQHPAGFNWLSYHWNQSTQ